MLYEIGYGYSTNQKRLIHTLHSDSLHSHSLYDHSLYSHSLYRHLPQKHYFLYGFWFYLVGLKVIQVDV